MAISEQTVGADSRCEGVGHFAAEVEAPARVPELDRVDRVDGHRVEAGGNVGVADARQQHLLDVEERRPERKGEVDLIREGHEVDRLKVQRLLAVGQVIDVGAEGAGTIEKQRVRQRTADVAGAGVAEEAVGQADAEVRGHLVSAAELEEEAVVDCLGDVDGRGLVVEIETRAPGQIVVAYLDTEVRTDDHLVVECRLRTGLGREPGHGDHHCSGGTEQHGLLHSHLE